MELLSSHENENNNKPSAHTDGNLKASPIACFYIIQMTQKQSDCRFN